MSCLLCRKTENISLYLEDKNHRFWCCTFCGTVYRDPSTFLDDHAERTRYLQHNNNPSDPAYQNFVKPLVERVLNHFPRGSHGLDYGAGTGPVIAKLLRESGFQIALYDPFFHPDEAVLTETYDFIVACEVIEHFHRPLEEFRRLRAILRQGGRLYCMTDPLPLKGRFDKWYYKDDPTHVIFYNRQNLEWIRQAAGFKNLVLEDRVVRLDR